MGVKMIQDLGKRMEKMQEIFTKDLKELKNKQRWTMQEKEATIEQQRQKNGQMTCRAEWWKSLPQNRI